MFLNSGISNIINTSAADIRTAPINFLLLNIFVLNIDFLLFLTLNTCVSSDNANVINAIVCPTSILDCSNVKSPIGSVVVPNPIINAAKVSPPIIIPWYITRHVIPFVNTPFFVSLGFLFIMSALWY